MKISKVVKYAAIALVAIILLTGFISGITVAAKVAAGIIDIFFDALWVALIICAIAGVVIFCMYKKKEKEKLKLKEQIIYDFGLDYHNMKKITRIEEISNLKAFFESVRGIDNCDFYAKFTEEGEIYIEAKDKETGELVKDITIKDYEDFLKKFAPAK